MGPHMRPLGQVLAILPFFVEGTKEGPFPGPNGSLQLHLVLKIWPPEISIFMQNTREGPTKIAISRDFWLFFNTNVFLYTLAWGITGNNREPPTPPGTQDKAAGNFTFHAKDKGRANKNRDFPRFLSLC